jgi:chitin-binding protein
MRKSISSSGMLAGCASSLGLLATLLASQQVAAHGYITEPPERAYDCRLGLNTNCGGAQYEPHSVGEGPKGFPAAGPADGKIPSAGNSSFSEMDIQTATRWHLNEIKNRTIEFAWFYNAAHKTTRWEYFITKTGWNPNEPLKRASFDTTPFCAVQANGGVPIDGAAGGSGPGKEKHKCTIPADRTGHHVVLGVWTVDDTASAFHKVIDVNITADGAPGPVDGWNDVGNITPTRTLHIGDKVNARAFVGGAESPEYSVGITVESTEEGLPQNWSYKLAQKVNATQKLIRAGVRDAENNIEPVKGPNGLYAKIESGVTSYQLHTEMVGDPDAYLHFHNIATEYALDKGNANVDFTVMTNRELTVEATVVDAANKQVGYSKQLVNATTAPVSVQVTSSPGAHQVLLVGSSKDGRINLQDTKHVEMTGEAGGGDHDFEFPNEIASYKAGTKVLQPKNGKVYECKPFPYEGWCKIYSPTANQYEPGFGSNEKDAWIAR